MDQDIHNDWRYTMDQDLHNSWRYLVSDGIKSRELKSHEHWHDQGGSIYGMPPNWKVFYTNHYECMCYYANRRPKVEHSSPSSNTSHECIPIIDARSPTNNENGNQDAEWNLTSVNRCVEFEHSSPSSDYRSSIIMLTNARSPTNNENGNQGT